MAKQTKTTEKTGEESLIHEEVAEQSKETGRVPAEPVVVYPVPQPETAEEVEEEAATEDDPNS